MLEPAGRHLHHHADGDDHERHRGRDRPLHDRREHAHARPRPPTPGRSASRETMTLRAIAAGSGIVNSDVASATYTLQAAAPTFNPPGGSYLLGPVLVTLSSSHAGSDDLLHDRRQHADLRLAAVQRPDPGRVEHDREGDRRPYRLVAEPRGDGHLHQRPGSVGTPRGNPPRPTVSSSGPRAFPPPRPRGSSGESRSPIPSLHEPRIRLSRMVRGDRNHDLVNRCANALIFDAILFADIPAPLSRTPAGVADSRRGAPHAVRFRAHRRDEHATYRWMDPAR